MIQQPERKLGNLKNSGRKPENLVNVLNLSYSSMQKLHLGETDNPLSLDHKSQVKFIVKIRLAICEKIH